MPLDGHDFQIRPIVSNPIKPFLIVLAILWLFAVAFNYYIVHKPFAIENALAILNALGDVFAAGMLFAIAAALGRRLMRRMEFDSPLEAIVLQAGLGLGLLSFAIFALGLAGSLSALVFWVVLIVAGFLLRDEGLSIWRDLRAAHVLPASRLERALGVFVAATLALAFLIASTPTLAWDAQVYHLVAGKIAASVPTTAEVGLTGLGVSPLQSSAGFCEPLLELT